MKATLDWPNGLDFPPVIYPMGDTDRETDAIRELLEKALRGRDGEPTS